MSVSPDSFLSLIAAKKLNLSVKLPHEFPKLTSQFDSNWPYVLKIRNRKVKVGRKYIVQLIN